MEEKNDNLETIEIEKKKSYPAVLINVMSEYDPLRKVYLVKYVYQLYVSNTKTKIIDDIYYLWDNKWYRSNTMNKLIRTLEAYNLNLIPRDFRNEQSIAAACSWLIGTKVELISYNYNGMKYKVFSTERKDNYRTQMLWKCLGDDCLDKFEERIKRDEEELEKLIKDFELGYLNENDSDNADKVSVEDKIMERKKRKQKYKKKK